MELFLDPNRPNLRYGYTTGTCAALAAKAAVQMLLSKQVISSVSLCTPKGIVVSADVEEIRLEDNTVTCAIRKDSGDDPDITNGILIYAQVRLALDRETHIDGGIGVGRVTKSGLACAVGQAAINPGPMAQIRHAVSEAAEEFDFNGGFDVCIFVPEGEKLARKTFNPRLGIEGGISILGTSGIVEPMSEAALLETIRLEIKMLHAAGNSRLVITPGNYGETFVRERLALLDVPIAQCSNFIGDTLDILSREEICEVLLVGHIGKLIKLAGGMMNTHSKFGDCRMEILAAHAGMCGCSPEIIQSIMHCITTEAALELINETGKMEEVMTSIIQKIQSEINYRTEKLSVEIIMFSQNFGVVGKTPKADQLIQWFQNQKKENSYEG